MQTTEHAKAINHCAFTVSIATKSQIRSRRLNKVWSMNDEKYEKHWKIMNKIIHASVTPVLSFSLNIQPSPRPSQRACSCCVARVRRADRAKALRTALPVIRVGWIDLQRIFTIATHGHVPPSEMRWNTWNLAAGCQSHSALGNKSCHFFGSINKDPVGWK